MPESKHPCATGAAERHKGVSTAQYHHRDATHLGETSWDDCAVANFVAVLRLRRPIRKRIGLLRSG